MIVNRESLDLTFRGFKSVYSDAYLAAPSRIREGGDDGARWQP